MKKLLALFMTAVLLISIAGCAKQSLQFDIKVAEKITVFSGATGKKIDVTEISAVNRITSNFNALSFGKNKSSKGYDGFLYQIIWYDAAGNQIESAVVMNATRVSYKGYFYDSELADAVIDVDFIESLMTPDTSGNYQLRVNDTGNYLYEQPAGFYTKGETVVIKTRILTDNDLECFVNGVSIGTQTAVKTDGIYTHWEFYFEMPDEDVMITFE